MIATRIVWHNAGPHTIWGKLAKRLGREPTNAEATQEVLRILSETTMDRAAVGKLADQSEGATVVKPTPWRRKGR